MLLAKLTYSRRQFSPCGAAPSRCPYALTAPTTVSPRLWRAGIQIVHRTSNIVHEQLPSSCLGPSCVLYLVHRQPPSAPAFPPLSNHPRPSLHDFSPRACFAKFPQLRCALSQIVHRTSYIVHGQTLSASVVRRKSLVLPITLC